MDLTEHQTDAVRSKRNNGSGPKRSRDRDDMRKTIITQVIRLSVNRLG